MKTRREETGASLTVGQVMTHLVVTLRPQDSIQDAARRLVTNRITGAPVVTQGELVGIVSEADLVSAYLPHRGHLMVPAALLALLRGTAAIEVEHATVGDVMSTDVISTKVSTTVWEAASLIDRHGVKRLPVLDDAGFVVGVVTRSDLIRAMVRMDERGVRRVERLSHNSSSRGLPEA